MPEDAESKATESAPEAERAGRSRRLPRRLTGDYETAFVAIQTLAKERQHPLLPVLEPAIHGFRHIKKEIKDYSALLIKRERIRGKLSSYQYMELKVRHRQEADGKVTVPFSVYLRFLRPKRYAGREVIYVEGKYHNNLIAKRGGRRNSHLTLQLAPDGPLAMEGNRYPVTEVGFLNLARRLIEVMREELEIEEACEVEVFDNARLNGRPCRRFRVVHPERSESVRFHVAEVLVDEELHVPVYYAAWTWPRTEGGKPVLLEEYVYTRIKINVGLTDEDFSPNNPDYGFRLNSSKPAVAEQEKGTDDATTAEKGNETNADGEGTSDDAASGDPKTEAESKSNERPEEEPPGKSEDAQ